MSGESGASRVPWAALALGGAAVAGLVAGALAERALVGRSVRGRGDAEPLGTLRSPALEVPTDDGAVLHVEVDEPDPGQAPLTVIFTHGYCLTLDCWHFQRRDLRGSARLVFWDQRGHGRSTRGPGGYGTGVIDRLGDDLGTVLDAVAPEGPVVLVGHSMGGMTVMALLRHRPDLIGDRVHGVALLGTSAGGLADEMVGLPSPVARVAHRVAPPVAGALSRSELLGKVVRDRSSDLGLLLTARYSFGSSVPPEVTEFVARMLAGTPLDVAAELLPAFPAHDATAGLAPLGATEVLVVVGTHDALTPESHSREIVRHVPGADLVLLPDTGHMLMLERHEEVSAHLAGLLARVRRDLGAGG